MLVCVLHFRNATACPSTQSAVTSHCKTFLLLASVFVVPHFMKLVTFAVRRLS